ncbi:hypothetical protein [Micromonospora sp. NPDC050200]
MLDDSGMRRWRSLGTCGRSGAEVLCHTA